MNRTIVFLCEDTNHIRLFKNMEKAFETLSYSCLYIVLDISIYLQLQKVTRKKIVLVKAKNFECCFDSIYQSKDYLEKIITEKAAKKIYESVQYYCNKIYKENKIDLFIVSQGVLTAEIAIKNFAENNNISILFFEMANICGKTFWDIEGSNARSYLYKNIKILDAYNISEKSYNNWKSDYVKDNLKQHIVKQAVNLKSFSFKYGILSRFNFLFTGLNLRKFDLVKKFKHFIQSRGFKLEYDKFNIKEGNYIFFPMQVASDSQIILNSGISLFDALKYAIELAGERNKQLVVKLHPAEKDIDVIKKVLELREKYNFKIVNDNTFQVIYNAEKIITINSTVALEAMILDKAVEILGKSYYKFFTKERIKNYILGYLEDIDFFSDKEFSVEQIIKLVQKCQK